MDTMAVSKKSDSRPKQPGRLEAAFLWTMGIMFILAAHFHMANLGGTGLAIPFNTTTWMLVAVALGIGLCKTGTGDGFRYSKMTLVLLAGWVFLTIPVFFPAAGTEGIAGRFTGLWAGLLLFVLLQQFDFTGKQEYLLLWFILAAVFIELLTGFFQFFFVRTEDVRRPFGVFQQPNVMASFLATGLALSGYLLARQAEKTDKNRGKNYILFLLSGLIVSLILALASRTGWLASFLCILLVAPCLFRSGGRRMAATWSLSIIAGLVLGFAILKMPMRSDVREGESAAIKVSMGSARRYTIPHTFDMIMQRPVFGCGYGRFEEHYTRYTANRHRQDPGYNAGDHSLQHPHNELLFWWAEGGIMPVAGILLVTVMIFARIYSSRKGTRLALLGLLVPIMLHTQLEFPFYASAVHWIVFVILLYWVDRDTVEYGKVSFEQAGRTSLRAAAIILPLTAVFYLGYVLHTTRVITRFANSPPDNFDVPEKSLSMPLPRSLEDKYDWYTHKARLDIGLLTGNPDLVRKYSDWASAIIKRKPRPRYYIWLVIACQALGETDKAGDVAAEAGFLFPEKNINWPVNASKLGFGLTWRKPEFIRDYIEWASVAIKRDPEDIKLDRKTMLDCHIRLVMAYRSLGEEEKADRILDAAKQAFPEKDFSKLRIHLPAWTAPPQDGRGKLGD